MSVDRDRKPRRIFGYARVSSEAQARGSSLEDQQAAIGSHAADRGLKVARYFVEAESAVHEKIERREQIQELMREAREGDLVLVDKLDRWSRDPEFTYGSIRKLLERGAAFFSVSEQCDPSTREGDTALGFRILFAREEHKRIKERMVGTRERLRDRGYYAEGLPPFGYSRPHGRGYRGADKNVLVIVPEQAEIVRRIFEMCIGGSAMTAIARELGINRDLVADTLRRRILTGQIESSQGEWIKGLHEPIVDPQTFERARAAVAGRRLTGERMKPEDALTSTWLLRDVARCNKCGARMSAVYGAPRVKTLRGFYYKCAAKCGVRLVPLRVVDALAEPMILARLDELRDELGRDGELAARAVVDTGARRERLEAKRRRTLDAFTDGHMTREELRGAMEKVDSERAKLDAISSSPFVDKKVRAGVLRDVSGIRRGWVGALPRSRREIARLLLLAMFMKTNEAPVPDWRPLEQLVNTMRRA